MNKHTIFSGFHSLYRNRVLLWSLVIRDVEMRYRGTVLGFLWAAVYPLMMLTIYTFVFTGVFKARWGGAGEMEDFVLMLYCGLIVHAIFAETLTRSPTAILANPGYVKKVIFPLELLPFSHLGSALFNTLISLLLLFIFIFVKHHSIPYTAIFTPLALLPLLFFTAGMAWGLAAFGVFLRDVGQLVTIAMTVLLFLSPVFYPISAAPTFAQKILYFNPLTLPMEELRSVLILGQPLNWPQWFIYLAISIIIAASGMWVFQKMRSAFAVVI